MTQSVFTADALAGEIVLVTGASRGIGAAILDVCVKAGATVIGTATSDSGAAKISARIQELGGKGEGRVLNIAAREGTDAFMKALEADFGSVTVLVNNAGITRDALLVKSRDGAINAGMTLEQWRAVIDVNLTGVFLCGRAAGVRMARLGNGGVIVNISSISRHGNIGQSNYSAAKAGVAALAEVWAKELARYGIRAASIAPGFVNTDIVSTIRAEVLDKLISAVPLGRLGEADEIAMAARFIFENDFYTGRCLDLDGGLRL